MMDYDVSYDDGLNLWFLYYACEEVCLKAVSYKEALDEAADIIKFWHLFCPNNFNLSYKD